MEGRNGGPLKTSAGRVARSSGGRRRVQSHAGCRTAAPPKTQNRRSNGTDAPIAAALGTGGTPRNSIADQRIVATCNSPTSPSTCHEGCV